MIIIIFFALAAGFLTVLSPCILPVLPIILSSSVDKGRYRPLGIIIGLILSFTFFTLALTTLVRILGISPNLLRYLAITLIIFFGITMLFPSLGDFFSKITGGISKLGETIQGESNKIATGFFSGFILGIALGLIWTPCAGPILATITTIVATNTISWKTVLITFSYSCGAGMPMFFIAYGGNRIINSLVSLTNYSENIRRIFGLCIIVGALLIFFHFDSFLAQITLKYFPNIDLENNKIVSEELSKLNPNSNPNFLFNDNEKAKAPDIIGITKWINSPPLTLEQLRGKVVLIDFWTYSCINCVRTLPYLKKWYDEYKNKNFVIIGVHTPEFEFEKDIKNVEDAISRFAITYPVALDNDYKTWQNYNNHYWPAHYLIDQNGIVQERHFGEGNYTETENAIRKLLGLVLTSEKNEQKSSVEPLTS